MPDATIQEIDAATAAIGRHAASMSAAADLMRARAEAERKLGFDIKKTSGALSALVGSADKAHSYFANALGGTAILGTFVKLASVGNDLTKTYRNMVEHGQNFNGSLLNMAQSAAAAGMPLDDFAGAITSASKVVARMGVQSFGNMEKAINTQLIQYGMLGMTQEQVTKNMSSYMETQRQSGILTKNNSQENARNFTDLMVTTTALSAATGVARDEISKLAQSAIEGSMAASRFQTMSLNEGKEASKKFQQSMAVLSSQAGEAGSFLAGLHANSVGTGNAAFTDQGKQLISVGLGNLGAMFENVKGPEEMVAAQEKFRKELTANVPLLRSLALGSGESAGAAQELLKVQRNMIPLTVEELRKKKEDAKRQDGLTKLFNTFSTVWNQMTASFQTGFLKGFKPLFNSVGDFTKSKFMVRMKEIMTTFGERVGSLIAYWLSEKNIQRVTDALTGIGDLFTGLITIGGRIVGMFISIASFASPLVEGFGLLMGGVSMLIKGFGWLVNGLSKVPYLVEGITAAIGAFMLFKKVKNMLGFGNKDKTINTTGNIYINGKLAGGGDDDSSGGPGGKTRGKGGFWNHVKRGFREGGRTGYGGGKRSLWKGLLGATKGAGTGLKSLTRGLGGGLKGGIKGLGGLLGKAAGPLAGVGLEGLDYLFGDKALSGKNLLKSGLSLGGGALGAIGGGIATAGLGGEFVGGAAGYAGGSALGDWLLGADDKKGANPAATKRSKLAMAGVGVGAAGIAASAANMADSLDQGTPEVATPVDDPMITQLKMVNTKLEDLNNTMVSGQSSIARRIDEQKGMLRGVINKPA